MILPNYRAGLLQAAPCVARVPMLAEGRFPDRRSVACAYDTLGRCVCMCVPQAACCVHNLPSATHFGSRHGVPLACHVRGIDRGRIADRIYHLVPCCFRRWPWARPGGSAMTVGGAIGKRRADTSVPRLSLACPVIVAAGLAPSLACPFVHGLTIWSVGHCGAHSASPCSGWCLAAAFSSWSPASPLQLYSFQPVWEPPVAKYASRLAPHAMVVVVCSSACHSSPLRPTGCRRVLKISVFGQAPSRGRTGS